jgi:glycosyltransferase involved in cell wall biosynthesis
MPVESGSPRVLWVTEEPPDRSLGGGNIRQAYLFEALARVFPTDLLVVGRLDDERVRAAARTVTELPARRPWHTVHPIGRRALELAVTLGSPYPLALYPARLARRGLGRAIGAAQGTYDLVCVEHEALAPLVPTAPGEAWIVTFHHLLSGMLERELEMAPGRRQRWFRARDLRKARALEERALRSYERCIVCSEEDATALGATVGPAAGERVAVVPNGADLTLFRPGPVPASPRILLPGTLNWPPNVDGAVWFCSQMWPRIKAAVAEATLVIAGRSPAAEVRALERLPGVSVRADVPSMIPYFESARAIVVPLRVGTGTRLKALEAMAAARPVIGTGVGLDGIGALDGVNARVADDPDAFATAAIEVLRDDAVAGALGQAARAHVESHFGWDRIAAGFVALASELLAARSAGQAAARSSSRAA